MSSLLSAAWHTEVADLTRVIVVGLVAPHPTPKPRLVLTARIS